ncbi:MAG: M15 family metallopeptidase [Pseudodesulfovibrio sp.]|nr:M15 family metallopeptidase [Pseudodesulfovibrio sp.]
MGIAFLAGSVQAQPDAMPKGFVHVETVIPDALYEVRYYTDNNFIGERIDGYHAPRVILTTQAAKALAQVQDQLRPFGLGIKIFDGYRPQQAVDHFVRWAKDIANTRMKASFYPNVDKKNLFRDGFIAEKSSHTRGSTVDLTLVSVDTGTELDMGTSFDYFGLKSWPDNKTMSPQIRANRALLRSVMAHQGFNPLKEEWWHFTLKNEPYPSTFFNFPIQ